MYIYAQLDDNNKVIGVSQLRGAEVNSKLLPLESYDTSVIGKEWTGSEFIPISPTVDEIVQLRKNKISENEYARNSFFANGVQYKDGVLHGGNQSAIDIKVLGIDLIQAGAVVPVWKVKEGDNIETPTLEQLTEMLTVVATNVGIGYKAEDIVKQQILALEDEEVVDFNVEDAFDNAIQSLISAESIA